MGLGVGHGAGLEPAVEDVVDAAQRRVRRIGRRDLDAVDVLSVQVGDRPLWQSRLSLQFGHGADHDDLAAVRGGPDGERGAPEAGAGDCPVSGGLEPVVEAVVFLIFFKFWGGKSERAKKKKDGKKTLENTKQKTHRFSLTYCGTQLVCALAASSFSLISSTRTNQEGTAL